MEFDLSIFNKEIEAGYITPDYEVYSNVPEYIKNMALDVNKEYKEIYNIDFFTFIDTPCLEPAKDLPPLPEYLIKIRKELEKEYKE